jgi:hypothetical protein
MTEPATPGPPAKAGLMTGSMVDLPVAAPDHVDAYCLGEYPESHRRFNGGVRAGG